MRRWLGTLCFLLLLELFAVGPLGSVRVARAAIGAAAPAGRAAVRLPGWRDPSAPALFGPALHLALRVAAAPAPPQGTVPTGLPNGTAHSVSLSWTGSTCTGCAIDGYNIFRASSAGGEAGTEALNGATPVTGTSFTDTNVSQAQTYYYVVSAAYTVTGSTTVEQSGFSNEASATVPGASNPTGCTTKAQ